MSHQVGVSLEGVRIPLSRDRVGEVARAVLRSERVTHALLSITFLDRRAMRALNRRHLRRDRLTDVIAFGFRAPGRGSPVIGDVYISPDAARESAAGNGVPLREEIVRLVVHGVLHVLGHHHPERGDRAASPMWRRQERLVRRLARPPG